MYAVTLLDARTNSDAVYSPSVMELVAEPKTGEAEDDFRPDAHALFFAPQEFAHVPNRPQPPTPPPAAPMPQYLSHPMVTDPSRDGLLSPYCSNGSFFASSHGSSSSASSPVPSSACSTRAVSPYYPMPTPGTDNMATQVFQLSLNPPSPAMHEAPVSFENNHPTPMAPVMAPLPPQYVVSSEESESSTATPRISPSKLGHRRAASKGLSLTIPPNAFANNEKLQPLQDFAQGQGSASNPTTPWPQMLVSLFRYVYLGSATDSIIPMQHTPLNPPPAPYMLSSPTQKGRLQQVWARDTADWNKASPALARSFEHELSAAVGASQSLQDAAARGTSASLKRSYTETDCSPPKKNKRDLGSSQSHALISPFPRDEEPNMNALPAGGDAAFFNSMFGARTSD